MTGGGNLISVGVLEGAGMEPDQGDTMKCNNEFKPKCPSCNSDRSTKMSNFGAALVLVNLADNPITLLSCVGCGHVIGAFSENAYQEPDIKAKAVTAKSSCCGSEKFVAYFDEHSSGLKDLPALILCGECESTVIATLPATHVWKNS